MPMIDKPLEELKVYGGINPVPKDFDEFWDAQLEKIHAFKSTYKVEKYPNFSVKGAVVERLTFIAPDGSSINTRIARPDDDKKHPVIFRFHGKNCRMDRVDFDFAYVMSGFVVAFLDCRSQPGLSEDATDRGIFGQCGLITRGLNKGRDYLYYKDVFLDVVQFVDIIKSMPYADCDKMYAHGGSQGGALTVICGALCPEIKALAPVVPFLSDYKRVYEIDLMKDAYSELNDYIRNYCPEDNEERTKMWTTLGYIDIQNFAKRIKGEVMWYVGLMDTICPPSTQFACYNKITSKKQMIIYTNYGHETDEKSQERLFMFITTHPSLNK